VRCSAFHGNIRVTDGDVSGIPATGNPIEQVFAKLKTLLRKTAARTVETLWAAVGTLLQRFSAGVMSAVKQT
jgi:hypothetical protein